MDNPTNRFAIKGELKRPIDILLRTLSPSEGGEHDR